MWGEGGGNLAWVGPGKNVFLCFTDSELTCNITTQIGNNEYCRSEVESNEWEV